MEAIITAATVLASYLSMTTTTDTNYAYNAAYEDGRVARIEVYDNHTGSLNKKLQYAYTYDRDGRLTRKEARRYDPETGEWTPAYVYTYSFDAAGYTVAYRQWDSLKADYSDVSQMTVYQRLTNGLMAVDNYRLNGKTLERTDGTVVMIAGDFVANK